MALNVCTHRWHAPLISATICHAANLSRWVWFTRFMEMASFDPSRQLSWAQVYSRHLVQAIRLNSCPTVICQSRKLEFSSHTRLMCHGKMYQDLHWHLSSQDGPYEQKTTQTTFCRGLPRQKICFCVFVVISIFQNNLMVRIQKIPEIEHKEWHFRPQDKFQNNHITAQYVDAS